MSRPPTTRSTDDASATARRRRTLEAVKSAFGTRMPGTGDGRPSTRAEEPGGDVRPGLVLEQRVGEGGCASVHSAFDRALLRRVALKRMHPAEERDSEDEVRFVDEAQVMARLDHPNVVPVHEIGVTEGGELYFTMKLVEGEDLGSILARKPPEMRGESDFVEALKVMIKVCDALSFAHSRGVVHRDLKPDNIMVGSYGQVYVMDWGIALTLAQPGEIAVGEGDREDSDLIDKLGTVIGTPGYMAPEQARGETRAIDARTDVYGLGGILYSVLTGFPPHFEESTEEMVESSAHGTVFEPEDMNPDSFIAPLLSKITMRALAHDPAERYGSVAELRDDLERFLLGGGSFPERVFEPGDTIVHEGEGATSAYLIASGACEVFKVATGPVVLRTMGPREVFGEASLFTPGGKRTASVRAATRVRALEITRDALLAQLEGGFWIGPLVKSLADRFLALDEELGEMGLELSRQQLVVEILRCVAIHGERGAGRAFMPAGALARRVSEAVGSTPERVLEAVADEPALSVEGDHVVLTEADMG